LYHFRFLAEVTVKPSYAGSIEELNTSSEKEKRVVLAPAEYILSPAPAGSGTFIYSRFSEKRIRLHLESG
jgi:hypothetical protein